MTDVWDRLLDAQAAGGGATGSLPGLVVGVVSNLKDPDGRGRVRVKLPVLGTDLESEWARVAAPFAGSETGALFALQVGDEVLVAFLHGDASLPVVLGGLWNGKDKLPVADATKGTEHCLKTKSGHVIRLVDEQGKELVEIAGAKSSGRILVDAAKKTVTVTGDSGVTIEAPNGPVTLKGKGIVLESTQDVTVKAQGSAEVKANAKVTVQSSGITQIKGSQVQLN